MLTSSVRFILVVVLTFVWVANTKNILVLNGLPSPSHHIWNREIINGLSVRGHNVTVLSTDFDPVPPANVHYLLLNDVYGDFSMDHVKTLFDPKENPFIEAMKYHSDLFALCETLVETNGFAQLLAYPDDFRFDLVIYDLTPGPCLLPYLYKFNYPPLVAVSAYNIPSYITEAIGGHQYYAYVPHNYLPDTRSDLNSILDRALNMLIYTVENVYQEYFIMPHLQQMYFKKFGPQTPAARDLEHRAILALVNMSPIMETTQPLPPNVIPVAGLHIKDANRLPADIESFINASRKGAVLIAFGTNIRSEFMSIKKRNCIMQALRELSDYHFLWKFESDLPASEVPENVLIRRWLPQSDILAHANVKAFLSHSGQLSTQEAIWRGVPLLCMPFVFDQNQNALKAKRLGVAEILDFTELTSNEIKSKLSKLLVDPKYAIASRKLAQIFRDRKDSPLELAMWHIEWTMRNPQAAHLKSPTLALGHIAANNYDVIASLTFAAVLVFAATWKLCILTASILLGKRAILNHNRKKLN